MEWSCLGEGLEWSGVTWGEEGQMGKSPERVSHSGDESRLAVQRERGQMCPLVAAFLASVMMEWHIHSHRLLRNQFDEGYSLSLWFHERST